MKNTFGNSVCVTLFGESHGEMIGAVLDGIAPGIPVDADFIAHQLTLRRPFGAISTGRRESDPFQIVSGVFDGRTTGTPICILIPNQEKISRDYESNRYLARPGHADLTANMKYHGFEDYRGGGHFSGRITAALVAAGAIAVSALQNKEILIGTHIKKCAGIEDAPFETTKETIQKLNQCVFPVLSEEAGEKMIAAIEKARAEHDSVGGILETVVLGLPSGVGEPWFDTIESVLSHAMFSIPAIKGVEFGAGFAFADMTGSEANDPIRCDKNVFLTETNHNGGVNGGITNGMPVMFRCAVKPTPSISAKQKSVNLKKKENAELEISGRHDPAIIHRVRVVVDSVTALVLCDQLSMRYGTDWLGGTV